MKVSNLFSNARIETDPFPYIVWDQLLDDDDYDDLSHFMPMDEPLSYAEQILQSNNTPWKEYVEYFTGAEFHKQILEKFDIEISNSVGVRRRDVADYVTESFISIRQPSGKQWCIYPHKDSGFAVTSMIHYFQDEHDDDNTGELAILRLKYPAEEIAKDKRIKFYDPHCFEIVEKIPYGKNNAVCLLNGSNTWHGVLPREKNIRRTVNISYERFNL